MAVSALQQLFFFYCILRAVCAIWFTPLTRIFKFVSMLTAASRRQYCFVAAAVYQPYCLYCINLLCMLSHTLDHAMSLCSTYIVQFCLLVRALLLYAVDINVESKLTEADKIIFKQTLLKLAVFYIISGLS